MSINLSTKKIVGPNGKWWIDEEGNMFLAGNLVIEGGLDPTFFTLVSQSSITVNNTIGVESNVFKYRDNTGTENNINLGDVIVEPADVSVTHTDTNTRQTVVGNEQDIAVSTSITLSSSSNKALILCGYVWGALAAENVGMKLRRGTTTVTTTSTELADLVDVFSVGSTNDTIGGGGGMHLDSPATTATRTYGIEVRKENTSIANTFGASIAVIEVTSAST